MNKKKILVVDDEVALVEMLCDELQLDQYDTLPAYNGSQAIDLILKNKVELIISDINMPVMDGLEMLEKLNELHFSIPVIFCTAFSDKDKIRKAWKLGAFDFLEKPVPYETLQSLLRNVFEFAGVLNNKNLDEKTTVSINSDIFKALNKEAIEKKQSIEQLINEKLKKEIK